jgi:hypothetical protein
MHIDHDICIFNVRRKRFPLGQVIRLALAVELNPIPTHAHNLHPIAVEGVRCRLVGSLDVNAGNHAARRKLVVA